MPSKREKGGERWEEGDRTAEKKFRKKPKQGDKETIDCVTSGDMRTVSRESCVVCSGDGVLAREREHARMRETKRNETEGRGEEKRGEERSERKMLPHTYTSDNKKGSIRCWVGGNINRGGETVLEDERQTGPEK